MGNQTSFFIFIVGKLALNESKANILPAVEIPATLEQSTYRMKPPALRLSLR
jgi:hypothetical protein